MISRFKQCGTAVFLAAVSLCLPAHVTAQNGHTYVVEGAGRIDCSDFATFSSDDPRLRDVASWLSGYLTAHHRVSSDIFDLSPWQTPGVLLGLLRQYCAANPDAFVENGAKELVGYLLPNALRESSDIIAMRNGEEMTLLYQAVMDQVRTALAEAGYKPGASDEALVKALESYQTDNDLPVTGLPDQATLVILLR